MEPNKFNYTYSAPTENERKLIENIKKQYETSSTTSTKLNEIKKLDNRVKNIPTCISLVLSILGLLIFGLGFTMILEWKIIGFGITVGIFGIVLMVFAYPIYSHIAKKLKIKYAEQIIKLSDELLNYERNE